MRFAFDLCLWLFFLPLTLPALAGISPPPDAETYQAARAQLKGQGDTVRKKFTKKGNRTIEFEIFISQDGDIKLAPLVLGNPGYYQRWALKDINKKPGGGTYFLQVHGMTVDPAQPQVLRFDSELTLPVFHKKVLRDFQITPLQKGDVFTLLVEALPNEKSPVASAQGFLRVYPAEGQTDHLWFYVKGQCVLRNWLLYEALPERVMNSEAGERIQIILDDYLAEEERIHQVRNPSSKPLKRNQIPTGKTAEQGSRADSRSQK